MSESRDDGSLIKTAGDEEGKMFVGGLSWETDEEKLRKYFEQFGTVRDCVIKRDNESGRSRGFGFVLFADTRSVDKALAPGTEHLLDGRNIDPKRARALKKDHKLFVGGLNPDTKTETIKEYFTKFGEVDSIERPNDRVTNKPRGFCFISFVKDGVIGEIINHSKFHQIDGRQCECKDGDPKKQANKGGNNQYSNSQFPMTGQPGQLWYGQQTYGNSYDYNSGYGGYGSYGSYGASGGYGPYGYYPGYPSYGSGYGGYGGGKTTPVEEPFGGSQMQTNQQNTGGKAKTAGRGGQNNYKPY